MTALAFNNLTSPHYHLSTQYHLSKSSGNTKNSAIISTWLGKSKSQILQELADKNLASVSFASWLAVPKLGVLIKFDHQICQNVDYYSQIN